jgi:hypothetical protein
MLVWLLGQKIILMVFLEAGKTETAVYSFVILIVGRKILLHNYYELGLKRLGSARAICRTMQIHIQNVQYNPA